MTRGTPVHRGAFGISCLVLGVGHLYADIHLATDLRYGWRTDQIGFCPMTHQFYRGLYAKMIMLYADIYLTQPSMRASTWSSQGQTGSGRGFPVSTSFGRGLKASMMLVFGWSCI